MKEYGSSFVPKSLVVKQTFTETNPEEFERKDEEKRFQDAHNIC